MVANQPFGQWGKVLPDPAMTLAAVDRLAVFQMAEVVVPKELFEQILRLIDGLRRRQAPA